jgi:hypothetical protein
VPGIAGNDEPHLVEPECPPHALRDHQVTNMGRVEGAAQQPEIRHGAPLG